MRWFLLISCLSLTVVLAHSQNTFEKVIIDVPGENKPRSVVKYKNGYLICTWGFEMNFGGWRAIRIFRTDSLGNLLWQKSIGQEKYTYSAGRQGSFHRLSDSSFVLGGRVKDSSETESKVLLVKFDSQVDTVWTKRYGQAHALSRANTVRQTKDGGYALFGWTNAYANSRDMYLIKTDSLGQKKWQKTYGDYNYFEVGRRLEETKDGGFILAGQSGANNMDNADGYFLKTDSAGNVEWSKKYGTQGDDGIRNITTSKDGGYLTWGGADTVIDNTNFRWTSFIAKLDESGNTIWRTYLPKPNTNFIWQVREMDDGSIVFIGQAVCDSNDTDSGWIGKLDKDGNVLWERFYIYQVDSDQFLRDAVFNGDFKQTKDGGYIVSGNIWRQRDTTQPSINTHHIWLVKLDSMGCLNGNCGLPVGIDERQQNHRQQATTGIYPNPFSASALVSVRADHHPGEEITFRLYSMKGELLRQQKHKLNSAGYSEWRLQRENLPQGVYVYSIIKDGNVIGQGKVVVE